MPFICRQMGRFAIHFHAIVRAVFQHITFDVFDVEMWRAQYGNFVFLFVLLFSWQRNKNGKAFTVINFERLCVMIE